MIRIDQVPDCIKSTVGGDVRDVTVREIMSWREYVNLSDQIGSQIRYETVASWDPWSWEASRSVRVILRNDYLVLSCRPWLDKRFMEMLGVG